MIFAWASDPKSPKENSDEATNQGSMCRQGCSHVYTKAMHQTLADLANSMDFKPDMC